MSRRVVMADGSPEYLQWTEEWLVGGAMLADDEALDAAIAIVTGEDFRDQRLARIWTAAMVCRGKGQVACVPLVAGVLHETGHLDDIGGEAYLCKLVSHELATAYCKRVFMEAHAKIVKEWSERRRVAAQGRRMVEEAYSGKGKIIDAVKRFRGGVTLEYEAL